jgi:hypothetical protein
VKPAPSAGFTLAEVAVTILIVGYALVLMLQGLNAAKVQAAYTRNVKLAKELALLTLGRIESGLYYEEAGGDERLLGTYAEEGYPDFSFEAVIGETNFLERDESGEFFDNWRFESEQDESDGEETEQPYEKVQIKVVFPRIRDLKNELVLERWLPWRQLHPPEEGEVEDEEALE